MNHVKKAHIKRAVAEHRKLGVMLENKRKLGHINKNTHAKAKEEHHFLGNLIGMLAKGAKMAAPFLSKGVKIGSKIGGTLAKNAKNIGHAVNAAGSVAQTGMALQQMKQANKASAAQERMTNAQAQGTEDQNAYLKKQMEGG
jgi:hypothetical protein